MVVKVKFYLLLLFLFSTLPVLSQEVKEVEGDAAFLFAYSVKEGQMNNFVEGFKKHLQWHMDKKDLLPTTLLSKSSKEIPNVPSINRPKRFPVKTNQAYHGEKKTETEHFAKTYQ